MVVRFGTANRSSRAPGAAALVALGLALTLIDGTAVAAPNVSGRIRASATTAATAPLPYKFRTTGWKIQELPVGQRPYQAKTPPSLVDTRPHDANGVRKFVTSGRTYDHPQGQAALALTMLDGYRLTGRSRYLAVAVANAQRLIATRVVDRTVVSDGAWFYPYRFGFSLHNYASSTMRPPWYSAMAQGQALSLFSRLAEMTGAAKWRAAADHTFASFLVPRRSTGPWVVELGPDGYVWLEEYAAPHGNPVPDRTFNGHNFATAGLYDYVHLTKDARAARLLDGAMTSVLARLPLIRNRNWVSHYCLTHPERLDTKYHAIQLLQLLWFHQFTASSTFARWADALMADYPTPESPGTVVLAAGLHTGYTFGGGGGSATLRLTRASRTTIDKRMRILGRPGYWYHVTAGHLAGTWLREQSSQYRYGTRTLENYKLARSMVFAAGRSVSVVAVTGRSGAVVHRGSLHYSTRTAFTFDARGIVNGVDRVRIAAGRWKGWWANAAQVQLDAR